MSKTHQSWSRLNHGERLLMSFLFLSMGPVSIADIQVAVFGAMASGTSMTRNTLRNPVTLGLVDHPGSGLYQISGDGVRALPMLAMREAFVLRRGFLLTHPPFDYSVGARR